MNLFISVNTASSKLRDSNITVAITDVAAQAALEKQKGLIPPGPSLDITFLLPGKFEKPGFSGMRMGGYSEAGDTLYFETSVPEHILKMEYPARYVALVMLDVIANAKNFFRELNIEFDIERWHRVMQAITNPQAITLNALA